MAAKSNDGGQVRRLLALALILEGHSREVAAELAGMERQTLPDWVHRYNAQGVAGLCSIRIGGRRCYLSEAQMAELKAVAIKGPDPETDKVVRWRCVDLRDEVARRFTVTVTERTIGKWLRKLGLTRLQPRPFHPKKDAAAQEAFKKTYVDGPRRAMFFGRSIDQGAQCLFRLMSVIPGWEIISRGRTLVVVRLPGVR
ncbi:MAG TPA: winged helix-turn-helix domain-containing protein [Candidatus Binatia bacterium]